MTRQADQRPHVAIVGGGLAGLAAAIGLADDCRVDLFEARRSLGGRAGSFRDSATGETVDHCQHVSMRCCTNLADFSRRVGIDHHFRRVDTLHFIGPDGRRCGLVAGALPAPAHLARAFWGLKFLSVGERFGIARAMWRLMRLHIVDDETSPTIGDWLRTHGQSERAIDLFWNVVLVSALAEELDRASLSAARKVIVDGFLSNREAYVVEVPRVALSELYGDALLRWFVERGVGVHFNAIAKSIAHENGRPRLTLAGGQEIHPDHLVLALPWHKLRGVVDKPLAARWPWLEEIDEVAASPITAVHLWFDRPIMPSDHAVLVGRLSQWIFHRDISASSAQAEQPNGHYYQVVISASHNLAGRDRDEVIAEVCSELAAIWPQAAQAQLLHARLVTEHAAVFSTRPGLDRIRPVQQTVTHGIHVAGDWTRTGWPATMEGAVRSGYLAAEGVLRCLGRPRRVLVEDLPRSWLARRLIRV
jgi:squalene-associated FAD-dependent desaturase